MTADLSIVIPARNEAENLPALVAAIEGVLDATGAMEVIVVDDGSTDATPAVLEDLASGRPWLISLALDRPAGQSAALGAGIRAARGSLVATLDADLQNDPADLARLCAPIRAGNADFAQGVRTPRRDSALRRAEAAVGRAARRLLLGDRIRDTGCAIRVLSAEVARRLPLEFRGMHRFLPVYARMLGARVIELPVAHRPRRAGRSHYGLFDRATAGFVDALAVAWMIRRYRSAPTRRR